MRTMLVMFSVWLLLPCCFTQAQISSDIIGNGIKIEIDPQYPNPGQNVRATLDDYSINNSGSAINWFVDGKNIAGTENSRVINFTAPTIGQTVEIAVKLTASNGQLIQAKQIIKPVYLDLIVEPLTYTPIYYQGRALPVNGSLINVNALVSTAQGLIDPAKYTYTWLLNNKSVYGGPRKGTSWAQISVPFGDNALVSVTVQDATGATIAKKIVNIPIDTVRLDFYEVNALYGLSRKVVTDSLLLIGNSTSIRAVPYNLDNRVITGNLFTQWSVDNQKVTNPSSDPFEINLSRGSGRQATVGFQVRNLDKLIQGDEKTFSIQF